MSTASLLSRTVGAAAAAGLIAASAAQVPTATTVVLTETTSASRSQLLAVDAGGGIAAFGRFPSDGLRPLALAVDALDRHAIVAVDLGGGTSRVLRLLPAAGLAFAGEVILADLPGPCAQLVVAGETLLAVVGGSGGGVYRLPRRGGAPVRTVVQPHACAMLAFGSSDAAILAWSGATTPPTAPGLVHVDTATGQVVYGPFAFHNLVGAEPTGLIDLPTALSRQLISFADGTFALHVGGLGDPTPVPMNPQPPPGGAAAFVPEDYSFAGLAVGGAAAPALYRADWGGTVAVLAFPLPGSPVDVAAPLSASPQVLTFGDACGLPTLQPIHGVMGPPQIGNLSFDLRVGNTLPSQLVFLVLGFDDVFGGALPLPVSGCLLHTTADFSIDWLVSNPGGLAVRNIPIPAVPQLDGAILFAQWAQFGPAGLAASPGIAVQVGL